MLASHSNFNLAPPPSSASIEGHPEFSEARGPRRQDDPTISANRNQNQIIQAFINSQNIFCTSKADLSKGDTSTLAIHAYTNDSLDLLENQFKLLNLPVCNSLLHPMVLKSWKDLGLTLSCEESPWIANIFRVSGTSPIYYATALKAFLESDYLVKYCEINSENTLLPVMQESIKRLRELLGPYLKTLVAIDALKIIPQNNDPEQLPQILSQWQGEAFKLEQQNEILYPLGWEQSGQSHFILTKLRCLTDSKNLENPEDTESIIKIDVFDAVQKPKEKYIERYAQVSKTALSLEKKATMAEQLKALYKIVPLMIPQCAVNELSPNHELTARKCATITYQALSRNAKKIETDLKSPLQDMGYMQGNNCVITSFRMLFYTLVHEIAEHIAPDLHSHYELKNLSEAFFNVFKVYVAEQVGISRPENHQQ